MLQNFQVSRQRLGRETPPSAFGRLKQLAAGLHVPIEHELRGQSFLWGGMQADFLWPEITPEEIAPLAQNNDSLVVRLQYGKRTILLPGDMEKQVECVLLGETAASFLHADVLKLGHHASKNSTMLEFLGAVSPQISILPAGEESPYGHPSPELLQRLEVSGSRVLRTDQDGPVQVLTDGRALRASSFAGCPEPATLSGKAQPPDHGQANQQ